MTTETGNWWFRFHVLWRNTGNSDACTYVHN